jgi:hypothetical protein
MRVILSLSVSSVELTPHFALSRLSAWFLYVCNASTAVLSVGVCVAGKEVCHLSFKALEWVCTSNNFILKLTNNCYYYTVKCMFIRELVFLG